MFIYYKNFIVSFLCSIAFVLANTAIAQQTYSISGVITLHGPAGPDTEGAGVYLEPLKKLIKAGSNGNYMIDSLPSGHYTIIVFCPGHEKQIKQIHVSQHDVKQNFTLRTDHKILEEVIVSDKQDDIFNIATLKAIEGTAIYEGKKTELIVMDKIAANTATNNARQIFAKVPGLIVWESDCGGLQLGIATRGLSPNRTANFNMRQDGYDISADAIGYPESYYTPSMEAIERVEVVRGAASLQYGTQFGGMVNFVFRKGPKDKPWEITSRQTAGSFGLFNSYNSIGGQIGKVNYFGYINYRQGDCSRPNSGFKMLNSFGSATYQLTPKLSATVEFTHMNYLAKQAGGLTDAQFAKDPFQSNRNRNWFKVGWNLPAVSFDYNLSERTKINVRTFALLSNRLSLGDQSPINLEEKLTTKRTLIEDFYRNTGAEARVLHHYKIGGMKSTVLVGGRYYAGKTTRTQGEGNNLSTGTNGDFTYSRPDSLENFDYIFHNKNVALFSENIFIISKRFTVTPGLRFEYINTNTNGYLANRTIDGAGNEIAYSKQFESRSLPRSFVLFGIGASYKLNEDNELYGNISQNYRGVTFGDIKVANPNAYVNPKLHDEKGYNADIGLRGIYKKVFYYDASAFYMAYKDRIGDVLKADAPPLYIPYSYRTNVSDSKTYGLESMIEWQFWKTFKPQAKSNLSVFVNCSLTEARYVNTNDVSIKNKRVEYVSPLICRTGFTYQKHNFTATLQWSYVAQQFTDATNAKTTSNAVKGIIPTYYVFDFSVKYQYKWLITAAGINNITNNYYYTRRSDSYPGPGIVPSDPRTFFVSLGVKIGKTKN